MTDLLKRIRVLYYRFQCWRGRHLWLPLGYHSCHGGSIFVCGRKGCDLHIKEFLGFGGRLIYIRFDLRYSLRKIDDVCDAAIDCATDARDIPVRNWGKVYCD